MYRGHPRPIASEFPNLQAYLTLRKSSVKCFVSNPSLSTFESEFIRLFGSIITLNGCLLVSTILTLSEGLSPINSVCTNKDCTAIFSQVVDLFQTFITGESCRPLRQIIHRTICINCNFDCNERSHDLHTNVGIPSFALRHLPLTARFLLNSSIF